MKKLFLISGLMLLCIAMLAGCPANPTPTPPVGGDNGKTVYRVSEDFPTAAGTVAAGAWGYYSVNSGSIAKGDYTALTTAADQAALGALGLSDGTGALGNGNAIAASGKDVAYGFTAPRDGVVTLSTDTLSRAENGSATFAIYKNGVRIWPLAADAYDVPTVNKAALVAVTTAIKTGDTLYFRVSTEGTAAKLSVSPVVTYEANAAYTTAADLEITRPDVAGTLISGAGTALPEGSLAITGRQPSTTVIDMDGADFRRALQRGNLEEGATYRITASEPVTIDLTREDYSGNNCVVYAPNGIIIEVINNIVFTDITVLEGPLTFRGGKDLTLNGVEAAGGMIIEESCEGIRMDNCRATTTEGTAFINSASSSTIVGCYFSGKSAMLDTAKGGNLYENCVFAGEDVAITLSGCNSTVWYSNIRGSLTTGETASENLLVTMNRFENLGGVVYNNTHNCVVLLNEAETVSVKNSTNSYVCSNTLYGEMAFENVNYLLATRNNAFGKITKTSLSNFNGDNITDVDARTEYGVNEDLLPHINKDAFINMERKDYIRLSDGSKLTISQYINQKSVNGGMLIIAPGAYSTKDRIFLRDIDNCTVYAYGVLYEKYDFFDDVFNIKNCKNYIFRGLTVDMVLNGCGQMVVLEKSNGVVYYRAAAGFLQDHTNKKYYEEGGNGIAYMGYHAGQDYPYADIALGHLTYNALTGLHTSSPSKATYDLIQPGDMVTCRANGGNVANLYENTAVQFEDVTILSGSIRCFWDSWAKEGTILNRVMVSPAPAKVLDPKTYEEYIELNEKYGIDTGVYIDSFGNYRGTPAKTVTADSTHTSNSRTGMKATSCIFEGLSDDGTNQQGFHGRLAGYDPETGTITYKMKISSLGYTSVCAAFVPGDRVYVYTSNGKTVCDTEALSVTRILDEINGFEHYSVQVDPAKFDHTILKGYDLTLDGANDRRILIDNRSRNGDGFIFDNMLIRNIRSRGFLVKCASNEIKHCSFYNIGMAAVGLIFEPEWGESGVCDNTLIAYNYFENTGYFVNQTLYSPITIQGLGSSAEEDCLPYKNIQIIGNVVRNRATDYALYINSSIDVTVKDNDFGEFYDVESLTSYPSVFINFAKNITFDNNTYSQFSFGITESIVVNGHINVDGSDVNGEIPDDPIMANSKHTTSFLDNLPSTGANGLLVSSGAWSVGCASPKSLDSFKPFQILTQSGWYSITESSLWSTSGGMDVRKDYRFAALASSNIVIRYTAEYSGQVLLRVANFQTPYKSGDGSADGYFAIFVNGEMVWPTKGGSYQNGSDWRSITQNTTQEALTESLSLLALELKEGDEVCFVAKRKEAWSAFAAIPFVYYTRIDEE
ncbi:MAG: hypothetical protein IJY20_05720 [Clostridia bacterium]|nr:hypothetical protein [Clostridia bacterium]